MTLTDLIKSAEEKLANPDLTLGTRRREEAILHHLTSLERTVTELESQNTELYLDQCEMGDMARERSRRRDAVIGIDLAGGVDYTVDTLIRHKWPEEKPEKSNSYLIMNHGGAFHTFHYFLEIEELDETEKLEEGWYAYPGYNLNEVVKYWWNLPEVTE